MALENGCGAGQEVAWVETPTGNHRAPSDGLSCPRKPSHRGGESAGLQRSLVAAICVAVLVAVLAVGARQADGREIRSAVRLDVAYSASLLGLPIGDITWTIDVRGSRFSALAHGATAGLLQIFAPGHGVAEAHGSVAGREPLASNFKVSFTSGNRAEAIQIVFSHGRAEEHLAQPQKPNPKLVPLTDASRVGVVDPMTALLIRVPGTGDTTGPAACERKIAVFDGHMRFDLNLVFKRIDQVRADVGYNGPAVVCAVYFTPLAGYDPSRSAIKYLKAERGMEIWLAPIAGTRLVAPFRISVPTPIGDGVLQATRFICTRDGGPSRATVEE